MTATTEDLERDDDAPGDGDDLDAAEDFDNPAFDEPADEPQPVERRERTTRIVTALAVAAVVALAGLRLFGVGPFSSKPSTGDTAGGAPIQVVLPDAVIKAIELAQQPGKLTTFTNRPSAQDPSACASLPPFTNEALYAMAAGDGQGLCERLLESGANPCTAYIGVATTDKGAIFYVSSSGKALPGQKSVPTKLAWCPDDAQQAQYNLGIPATTTTAAAAQPGGR